MSRAGLRAHLLREAEELRCQAAGDDGTLWERVEADRQRLHDRVDRLDAERPGAA